MKILVVSPHGDGAWFVWLLQKAGHDVQWHLIDEKYAGLFHGIITEPLKRAPDPSRYDLVIFDTNGEGDSADDAMKVTSTIGGSSLADKLEDDRLFGLEVMEHSGIRVPEYAVFDTPDKGIAWLQKTHKRTVFKPIGDDILDKSTTYVSKGEADMIQFMERVFKKDSKIKSFVLQEVVSGVETAAGGWFNGEEWVVVDHNIELKKLMNDNVGPNTGCAGSMMWLPARPTPLFQQGLEKVTPWLREVGYVGPLDLNTIVTEGTAYGIEWTPRFGYESTCNFTALLPMEFGEFLHAVANGDKLTLAEPKACFSSTIRCAVPPYPNADNTKKRDKVPILGLDLEHLESFYLGDVQWNDKDEVLETTGLDNMIGAPIGASNTIVGSFDLCMDKIKALNVPNLMYRTDVESIIHKTYNELERMGWLKPLG